MAEHATNRLLIVSNRLPVTVGFEGDQMTFHPSAGGLATGLASYLDSRGNGQPGRSLWIGWPGADVPAAMEKQVVQTLEREHHAVPVFIGAETMSSFYEGFCNDTLWPLFHYFPSYASFKNRFWTDYYKVNEMSCEEVDKHAQPGDEIWVHDYPQL